MLAVVAATNIVNKKQKPNLNLKMNQNHNLTIIKETMKTNKKKQGKK